MDKKSVTRNSIIVLIITIVFFYWILKDDFIETMDILFSSNLFLILVAIILYFIYFTIESKALHMLIGEFNSKYSFKESFKLNLMSKFFNGITPLSSGGQPLQIYELKKQGIKLGHATNITVQNLFIYQTAMCIICITCYVLNLFFNIFKDIPVVVGMANIGFLLNIVLLVFLYIISFSKTFNKKVITGIIKFLHKLNVVKNKKETIKKWEDYCLDFYNGFQILIKNKKMFFTNLFIQVIGNLIYFLVPVVILESLGLENSLTIGTCLIASSFVFLIGSYIPLPGGSGGTEMGFLGFFGVFTKNVLLNPALLVWRFVTYFLPMIIGGIIFNFHKRK